MRSEVWICGTRPLDDDLLTQPSGHVLQIGGSELPYSRRKGGYPAVTDANLALGRILPEFFPSIFGESEDQPLDAQASVRALEEIAGQVNEQCRAQGQPEKSVDEVTSSFPSSVARTRDIEEEMGWVVLLLSAGGGGGHRGHKRSCESSLAVTI